MNNETNHWETEKNNRQHYLSTNPELSHSTAHFNYATFEKGIGITNVQGNRTEAYWPLGFSDYCVEEHLANGLVASIDKPLASSNEAGDFLILHIISSVGTVAIVNLLRQVLSLEHADIGFASNKEPGFISSQFISLPASKAAAISALSLPSDIIVAGTRRNPEHISIASLKGHTYTMLLRTKEALENESLVLKTDILAKYGALNYFPPKRFGRRHLAHLLGKLLLQENFELAVKNFLCQTSPSEELLITRLREVASTAFPNHEKMEKIFSALPATFANELAMIRYLGTHQADFAGAILQVKHLARQWLFSYGAYIFNSNLSEVSASKGVTQERFPWTFSPDTADKAMYRHYFERDGIFNGFEVDFIKELIPAGKQLLPGRIFPKDVMCRSSDGMVALSLFLEGNLPAETVMANLFNITNALPVPEWASAAPADAKKMLGQGSLLDIALKLSQPHA